MNKNRFFDVSRFKQLLVNEMRINFKPMLISAATLLVFLLLFSFDKTPSVALYTVVLFVGGFAITSRAFKDLHNTEVAYHYLTLPCSNFERFLSKWLITSIGYAIALLAVFCVYGVMRMAVISLLFQHWSNWSNLLNPILMQSIGVYIIIHSLVLLGAVIFKRHNFLKTALSLGSILFATSLITGSISLHFFPIWVPSAMANADIVMKIVNYVFWFILAPFCWLVTYLRITETELH
ncbi:MAG: hypothetical protein M3R00_07315 [Pseudomonadota bacterium]|nr:hypothetical protein [Pseudomonadota bacterium]